MRRLVYICALLLVGLLLAQSRPAAAQTNLIRNPGFEAPYSAWGGIGPIQVAHEWTPWWSEQPDHNPPWYRPEWKPAEAQFFPNRVLSGERAQQWFTFHASHYAGMYQQVFNVVPGVRYQFSIYAQVWSSVEDDPYPSVLPANPRLQIGIDPTGNWNPYSGDIVWSGEAPMNAVIDQWGYMVVEATAQSNVITVFMKTSPDFANKHNDTYWDNANLIVAGQAPPPTNTPAPPTPIPSDTPVPPPTAVPSDTPVPPPTAVPSDTPIPPPTNTPAPPTATLPPTNTPIPATDTPAPTATEPPPTETPAPTNTATATATVEVILETIEPTEGPTALPEATAVAANADSGGSGAVAEPGEARGNPPAAVEEADSSASSSTILVVLVGGLALLLTVVVLLLVWRRITVAG